MRDDSTARGRNLLIVDDEIAVLEIMRETLVSAGYKVAAAASGPEALARAEANHLDAAIVDLMMPGMNGAEMIGQLRARRSGLAVVVLTGMPGEKEHSRR